MKGYEPQVLYGQFRISDAEMDRAGDGLVDEVKQRIARMLADKLADNLMECRGGAIYSPVTFTIRPDDFDMTRIVGTVNAQRLPDPETGEFRLIDGPLHNAIVRVGDPPPSIYRIPYARPLTVAYTDDSGKASVPILEYERVKGVQAYRYAGEVR